MDSDYSLRELLTKDFGIHFIDSHFHSEILFDRSANKRKGKYMFLLYTQFCFRFRVQTRSMNDFITQMKTENQWPVSYGTSITNFHRPAYFHYKENADNAAFEARFAREANLFGTVGVHPSIATQMNPTTEERMRTLLSNDTLRFVGIGETGIDLCWAKDENDVNEQLISLKWQMGIAKEFPHKALVIHLREKNSNQRSKQFAKSAEEYLWEALVESPQAMPTNAKIHFHSFMGSPEFALTLLNHFPNSAIGFSPAIIAHPDLISAIPDGKYLLETDAPYFEQQSGANTLGLEGSHPGLCISVIDTIASIKGKHRNLAYMATIIYETNKAVERVYSLSRYNYHY